MNSQRDVREKASWMNDVLGMLFLGSIFSLGITPATAQETEVPVQSESPRDVNDRNTEGETILMLASFLGKLDEVTSLIEAGADVNAKNIMGSTALMMASQKGHAQVVKVLLNNGSEVNVKDKDNYTALLFASWGDTRISLKLCWRRG